MRKASVLWLWFLSSVLAGGLPQEARFEAPVSLPEAAQRAPLLPLDVVLEALAKSVGLQPLVYREGVNFPLVRLELRNKPFREVWELLFATYGKALGLAYAYRPPDVVVVGPERVVGALEAPEGGRAEERSYLVPVPLAAYTGEKGVSLEGAKAWAERDLLPFVSGLAPGLKASWLLVEAGGRLHVLLSLKGSPQALGEAEKALEGSPLGLRPLGEAPLPEAPEERSLALKQASFPDLLPLLRKAVPEAQVEPFPTDPRRALARGPKEALDRLEGLLRELDRPKEEPRSKRLYPLAHKEAGEVLGILGEFLRKELPGVRLEGVAGNPRALLAEGTEEEHRLLAEVLRGLDQPSPAPPAPEARPERRLVRLKHADAEKAASFLAKEVPGLLVQALPEERLLSLRGTPEALAAAEAVLEALDRPKEAGPPLLQRSYQLSNAKATDLAKVLQEALQAQQAKGAGQAGAQAPRATVVADERTNTLIVTGTQEDLALVESLIPKLDQAVPQVALRVRIQEVQSNLSRNLGLKWNQVAGGRVAASVLDAGLSLIFDSTKSLAALNLLATLEALQRQGLSRALRDVSQTVLSNQTARIQSGETFLIRRVVGDKVERTPFDIGIIVEVTPQVTADGQILLNIKAEVSGNVQRNPVDGDVDRFTKQVVTTSLRVRDGQTIVLGGLASQENNQVQQGVPLLMDIPLIGELFKQRTEESTDRELLVVITADILKEASSR